MGRDLTEAPRGGWQELLDAFYHRNGPCCAGCDWWRSISPLVGECHRSAMVSGEDRMIALDMESSSLRFGAGHAITRREHICGEFKDDFDWSSLPLSYRRRVGAPIIANADAGRAALAEHDTRHGSGGGA